MDKLTVACVQQRMAITSSHQEFEDQVRRFMRMAQAKAAQVIVFPELTGLMLAPPLFSGVKLGFIRRAHEGSQPGAGAGRRGLKRVAEAAAGALGGFRGSLDGLLRKHADRLWDAYAEMFGRLAREFGMVVAAGTVYVYDAEGQARRHRATVFDVDGQVLGWQDKLNLGPDELDWATPGTRLAPVETQYGRLGVMVGWDALYPEIARALAAQGAELLIGVVAAPGVAQARMIRAALGLRAEENQVYAGASFLLGPNYAGQANREEYFGHTALLAPISLTDRGSGALVQVGTNRAESLVAGQLDFDALHALWASSNFRPRQQMALGDAGPLLADLYGPGRTIQAMADERAAEAGAGPTVEAAAEPAVEAAPASGFARVGVYGEPAESIVVAAPPVAAPPAGGAEESGE